MASCPHPVTCMSTDIPTGAARKCICRVSVTYTSEWLGVTAIISVVWGLTHALARVLSNGFSPRGH